MVTVSKKVSDQQNRWKLFKICSLLHCTNVPSSGSRRMELFCKPFFIRFHKLSKQVLVLTKTAVIRLWKVLRRVARRKQKKVEENKNMKRCQCYIGRIFTYHIIYVHFNHVRDRHRLPRRTTNFLLLLLFLAWKLEISYNVYVWLLIFHYLCLHSTIFFVLRFSFSLMHHCTYGHLHFVQMHYNNSLNNTAMEKGRISYKTTQEMFFRRRCIGFFCFISGRT